MTRKQVSWHRFMGEAVLIISSVFVAIALESAWQDRQEFLEAQGALGQMLQELQHDRADLAEILDEQRNLDTTYRKVIGWLADPDSLPEQEFGEAVNLISYSNRTMYPRRAAWTTMVASGQLRLLNDAELVTKLGDLYENLYQRLMVVGNAYDRDLFTTMRESVPRVWDYNEHRLLTLDAPEIARLRGELRFMHYTWNQWYLEFLIEEYGTMLDELIVKVDAHLSSHRQ